MAAPRGSPPGPTLAMASGEANEDSGAPSDGAWIEVQVETGVEAAELVAAAVAPLTGGVELRDAETVFPTARDRGSVVALCRPQDEAALLDEIERALDLARAGGTTVDPVTLRRRAAHEDEWRDVWKQFFRATRVGARFVVRPSWDQDMAGVGGGAGDHVIDLDPGRAFGTGAHPSTRLVIRFVEEIAEEWSARFAAVGPAPPRFLDLGCGSGILSIVAARLWPQARGLAVDLDEEATACAGENFERNAVASVDRRTGSIDAAPGFYDLIMANIQADVLQGLAPELARRLRPGGALVLSGLLTGDVPAVHAAYQATGLRVTRRADEGEWAALLLAAMT
jgi:ribosomal protein L11 methyltransferase